MQMFVHFLTISYLGNAYAPASTFPFNTPESPMTCSCLCGQNYAGPQCTVSLEKECSCKCSELMCDSTSSFCNNIKCFSLSEANCKLPCVSGLLFFLFI